jgi:hypothetical protein
MVSWAVQGRTWGGGKRVSGMSARPHVRLRRFAVAAFAHVRRCTRHGAPRAAWGLAEAAVCGLFARTAV